MITRMKTRTCQAAAATLVLGLVCALPAAAQNTAGPATATTTTQSAPGALSAPIGGDRDRDWDLGWLGLLGLLGLAGLRGRRDDTRDIGGTRTGPR